MNRRGTSLMEVMVALLMLGVGILGVMSLFPIAITRAVEASRLTNATILSKQADALVDMHRLVTDDFVPQPKEGYVTNCVIDPLGWHDLAGTGFAQQYGNNGTAPVQYVPPIVQTQRGTTQFVGNFRDILISPDDGGVVVNPPPNIFPDDVEPSGTPLRRLGFAANPIPPYPAGSPLAGLLRDGLLGLFSLPDNFDNVFTADPDPVLNVLDRNGRIIGVGFPSSQHDLRHLQTSGFVPRTRATLFDATGRTSQIRETADGLSLVLDGDNWIISWTPPLPADFGAISEVRVEFPEVRYTWMLTVRKRGIAGGSVSEIDCVVFHNRPLGDPSQEFVWTATQPGDLSRPITAPNNIVDLTFSTPPPIRKGGWVFDPQNCHWYRVLDILSESENSMRVQLERNSRASIRNLIIPEGVVNVFSLRSRVDQKRLEAAR